MQSHTEIAEAAERFFANDKVLDIRELETLMALALRDRVVNDKERKVLGDVFARVKQTDVSHLVWERIKEIRKWHNID
jgi:hypothetical protein